MEIYIYICILVKKCPHILKICFVVGFPVGSFINLFGFYILGMEHQKIIMLTI